MDRSIRHFQKAIQLGSEFGENYLGLAEAYIENGDFVLAKDVLHVLLNMKLNSQKEESVLEWRTEASKFLKKNTESINRESHAERVKDKEFCNY